MAFTTLSRRLVLLAALVFATHTVSAGGEPPSTKQWSKAEARALAWGAIKAKGYPVARYKVQSVDDPDDKATWRFFFRATGDLARPGSHVLVVVNKKTREVEVMQGE